LSWALARVFLAHEYAGIDQMLAPLYAEKPYHKAASVTPMFPKIRSCEIWHAVPT